MSYGPTDPMNPYQTGSGNPMGPAGDAMAAAKVKGPAVGLLVTGGLGIGAQVGGLLYAMMVGQVQPQLPPDADPQQVQMMENIAKIAGPVQMVTGLIAIMIGVVIVLGALKMMKLQSYGLAMTSAILAMIPCISPCCLLGLPIGIWAITALNDSNVKASFR